MRAPTRDLRDLSGHDDPMTDLLLLALLTTAADAAEAPCVAAVRVTSAAGDDVGDLARALQQRGVVLAAGDGPCPVIDVDVRVDEDTTVLRGHFPTGKDVERRVHDVATAAAVIESWSRTDLIDPLLAPAAHADGGAVAADAPPRFERAGVPPAAVAVVPPAPALAASAGTLLGAAAEVGLGTDGSLWPSIAVDGCMKLGLACGGFLGRASLDTSVTGASADEDTGRVGIDGYAVGDLALDVGGLVLRPGVGVGVGWLQSRNSPVWSEPHEHDVDIDAFGMRALGRVTLDIPVGENLLVSVSTSADVALLAHTNTYEEQGETFAGQPLAFVRVGVGLGARP